MEFYDIHAHLADKRIYGDAETIVSTAAEHGVSGILAAAARLNEWERITALCSEHKCVHGALGLHPFFIDQWSESLPARLKETVRANPKISLIGEVGLDFYNGRESRDKQIKVLESQLAVAGELHLPVLLHNRKSWPEFFSVWRNLKSSGLEGVLHHFTGSCEIARQALDEGLFFSFCGPLTFPNARKLKQAAEYVPLERILTETDTPDLPGEPFRSRGEESRPWQVKTVLEEIARLKDAEMEAVAEHVAANYRNLVIR